MSLSGGCDGIGSAEGTIDVAESLHFGGCRDDVVPFNLDEKYRFRIRRYRQRLTGLRCDLEECSIKKLARGSAKLA